MPPAPTPKPNYDFIMNPASPPKRSLFGGGNSLKSRIFIIAGGALLLIIVASVGMSILRGGGSVDKSTMLSVIQDQTELKRLSQLGVESGVTQPVKNFSITSQLTMASDQATLLDYLKKQKYVPNPKTFGLKRDAAVTKQLEAAKSSSTFDTAYTDIMKEALSSYQKDLTTAYQSAGPNGKKILNNAYSNVDLLRTQLTGETKK